MSSGLSSSTRALIDELISFLYSLDSRNASAAFSYSFSAKNGTPAGAVIGLYLLYGSNAFAILGFEISNSLTHSFIRA